MAELHPAPFDQLVCRLYQESRTNQSVFALPRKKWYLPEQGSEELPDLTARFHGLRAGNPCGPAAGPHTQMAQNLLLSYVAGGRILELKTVQVNDRLTIPRPCIDMTNIGYNVEWSQELRVEESLREYVAGMMLVEIFRRDPVFAGDAMGGAAGEVVYDMSVGYDLAGIRSLSIQRFFDGMRDASAMIESLRAQIPAAAGLARGLDYPARVSGTLTLSTFHGCPADEIERICEHLLVERDLDVVVKMNPPMLGRERLENLLHEVLGYTELTVNPAAYESGLRFDEAVQLTDRLTTLAKRRGRSFGCKFSNTLEVLNHRSFFTPENKVQYLSGAPLHVITMTLADVFRQAVGAAVPISFSAGIDSKNFPLAVACGFVPVTACSDLLKPGGYGRLSAYPKALARAMHAVGAANLDEYKLRAFGQGDNEGGDLGRVALANTTVAAGMAREDERYRADANRAVPKRVSSTLVTFDCLTCDKCIPVCPNAANFDYPTVPAAFDYHDISVSPDGTPSPDARVRRFEIKEPMQIGNYADFCNDCGNCDTFCPEHGGPYLKKPSFHGSLEAWRRSAPRDGYFVQSTGEVATIWGRIESREYRLTHDRSAACYTFTDGDVALDLAQADHRPMACRPLRSLDAQHLADLGVFHTLRQLLHGVLDTSRVNQINAGV